MKTRVIVTCIALMGPIAATLLIAMHNTADAAPPLPVHRWSFNDGTATDTGTIGGANGSVAGGSPTFAGGQLVLDNDDRLLTSAIGAPLGPRTLVSWLSLSNLDQQGGASPLTVQDATVDRFDGIVYAERETRTWMAGSSFFDHSQNPPTGRPQENTTGEVMVAIAYRGDNSIALYREGVPYGTPHTKGTLVTYDALDIVGFGRRVDFAGPELDAAINENRIYDVALTDADIAELFALGPDQLEAGAAVPEPSTSLMAMLALAVIGALGWRRRGSQN